MFVTLVRGILLALACLVLFGTVRANMSVTATDFVLLGIVAFLFIKIVRE